MGAISKGYGRHCEAQAMQLQILHDTYTKTQSEALDTS